jgi:hypothetical protein
LTWVYLEYPDEAGHKYGNGKEFDIAVRFLDDQVARLWEVIRFREENFNEEWAIIVTSDHGRNSTGLFHSWQTSRERSIWIATNLKGLNEHFFKEIPAIVDILPTIAAFMKMEIPWKQAVELDGVSLIGKLSGTQARAVLQNDSIAIQWNVLNKEGIAKIWLSTTNNFFTGGEDDYILMDQIPVIDGYAKIGISQFPSDFYKLVIGMPNNVLNRWIIKNNTRNH